MKVTLWLLNRCVSWEEEEPGVMAAALTEAGHDVTLGQRCVARPADEPAAGHDAATSRISRVEVNQGIDSAPGALMHEGEPDVRPSFDEYFVPIALKCIGNVTAPSSSAVAFWARTRSAGSVRSALFERIVDGSDSGGRIHPCFDPVESSRYWQLSEAKKRSERTPVGSWPFADVRMNTVRGCGFYQILQEHTLATGRKNVLVGYSQGGTVARYLAYLDQEVYAGDPCIHGVVSVQGALRGSPLALTDNADWIARAVTTIAVSLATANEHPDDGGTPGAPGNDGKRAIQAVVERAVRVGVEMPHGASVFAALATLLDATINANGKAKDRRWLIDMLRTTRKWISGLSGEKGLAFRDLDPTRLDQAGSVLNAIDAAPDLLAWHGAVVGADYRLEDLVRRVLEGKWSTSLLEHLFRPWLTHYLQRAEDVYRNQVMDVAGEGGRELAPRLARFRDAWVSGAGGSAIWSIRARRTSRAPASTPGRPTSSSLAGCSGRWLRAELGGYRPRGSPGSSRIDDEGHSRVTEKWRSLAANWL
jgi:hypothetical protein